MNCLYSTNTGTLPLMKFRGNDDSFEDSKNLVRHVVKCIQNRQIRHSEHLSTLSDAATAATEKVMEEITEQMRDGQLEDIRQFLKQGGKYGKEEECKSSEVQTNFRRLPEEHVAIREQTLGQNLGEK